MTTSDSDSTGGDIVYTPAGTESPTLHPRPATSSSNITTTQIHAPTPIRLTSLPAAIRHQLSPDRQSPRREVHFQQTDQKDEAEDENEDEDEDLAYSDTEMQSMRRPSGGRSHSHLPLLPGDKNEQDNGNLADSRTSNTSRPGLASRRSTMHSQSPSFTQPENLTRKKYLYASFFLLVSLVSFVVQTETAVYIQHELKWNKAYCMLWLTHGSWITLWPVQLLILRIQKRNMSWKAFWRRHVYLVRSTAQMIRSQDLYLSPTTTARSPWRHMAKTTAFITTFLTMAGASWYIAVNLTSPSDLTAIYNCSAFFAYVFSILLLKDKIRTDKVFSVALAIIGVLVVAYGDNEEPKHGSHSGGATNPNPEEPPSNKFAGNLMIGIGSVLYGLYEVLYKKYACPPEGTSPGRGMIFANTFGSMIGLFTITFLWIPIPILHYTGIEIFELPRGKTAAMLAVSTLSNATFSGAFLILMSLTSPVLSSVAALLTIFLVAITDWWLTGKPLSTAAIGGGTLIIIAFLLLSWATYREMIEEQRKRETDEDKVFEDDVEGLDGDVDGDDDDDEDDNYGTGRGAKKARRSLGRLDDLDVGDDSSDDGGHGNRAGRQEDELGRKKWKARPSG